MKLGKVILICLCSSLLLNSCKNSESTALIGNWVGLYEWGWNGGSRTEAVSFVIGSKAYVGLGFDGKNRILTFSAYDSTTHSWSPIAPMPISDTAEVKAGRTCATAFVIGNKGYVATGWDGENTLNDTYEYDPATDHWTQKASLVDTISGNVFYGNRQEGISFGFGDKGYLGLGYNIGNLNDFWRFNPNEGAQGRWHKISSFPGTARRGAVSFIINGKAYVCCGVNNNRYVSDFWCFDPSTETWTQLRSIANVNTSESYDDNYTTIVREWGLAFVIDSKAYITCGTNSSLVNNTWEYDPIYDLWTEKTAFEGGAREFAVAFSFGNWGFVGLGNSSSLLYSDWYEFKPKDADITTDNGQ